jgi:hypothetical protein
MVLFKRVQLAAILTGGVVVLLCGTAPAASPFKVSVTVQNNTSDIVYVTLTDGPGNYLNGFTLLPNRSSGSVPVRTSSTLIHVSVNSPKGKKGLNTFKVSAKNNVLRVKINKGNSRYDVRSA